MYGVVHRPFVLATRRQMLAGSASIIGIAAASGRAEAWSPWWTAFSAGVASGWLVEALKSWGYVPGGSAPTTVQTPHAKETDQAQRQGYSVRPMYSGAYSGGDYELSEALRGEDFMALGTSNHGSNTCTVKFDKADAITLGLVASALRRKGLDAIATEAATLPIHPPSAYRMSGDRRHSQTFETPSHGTIAWSTNLRHPRPNMAASLRSGIVRADLRFARLDDGKWTFDVRPA